MVFNNRLIPQLRQPDAYNGEFRYIASIRCRRFVFYKPPHIESKTEGVRATAILMMINDDPS
jgi:hypothetical protein